MKKNEPDLSKGLSVLPPFPIVLVTVGQNIMTAGAFHFYSFEPPAVMVGIMPKRYTYDLIEAHRQFGINIPRVDQLDLVRICGSQSGRSGIDKFKAAGVTPFKGSVIQTSLVAECPLNLECAVVHHIDYPGSHHWYIGEIQAVHIDEDYHKEQALTFWGRDYHRVGPVLAPAK